MGRQAQQVGCALKRAGFGVEMTLQCMSAGAQQAQAIDESQKMASGAPLAISVDGAALEVQRALEDLQL